MLKNKIKIKHRCTNEKKRYLLSFVVIQHYKYQTVMKWDICPWIMKFNLLKYIFIINDFVIYSFVYESYSTFILTEKLKYNLFLLTFIMFISFLYGSYILQYQIISSLPL